MTDKAKKFRCKRCREMWVTENYSVLRERTMDIWDKEIPRVRFRAVCPRCRNMVEFARVEE